MTSSVEDQKTGYQRFKKGEAHNAESKFTSARVATELSTSPRSDPDPLPSFLRLLPINIYCNKGAVVIGNEHTETVITARFEKAHGEFDAKKSGPLDIYQQVFNFKFTHPVVHMRQNPDYKSRQLEAAVRYKEENFEEAPHIEADEKPKQTAKKRAVWSPALSRISGLFSKSTDSIRASKSGTGHVADTIPSPGEGWRGLPMYLDDSQRNAQGEWEGIDYAKTTLILDCPRLNVCYYWDIAGRVPGEFESSMYNDPVRPGDINGSMPPEYGMDIQIFGGTINYGPWADRQRAIFQSIYFPASYVDAIPAHSLAPGDPRVLTLFKLYLSIEDDTVLRIPVRESSKDWKWKGKAHNIAAREKFKAGNAKTKSKSRRRPKKRDTAPSSGSDRPFGWIDIKVAGNSSVNYIMDMVASKTGFQNKLDVDIVNAEISSSVNHGLLWRSGSVALGCDLSTPLGWNHLRKWVFNIKCRDLELFLLRDHLFLLTDLVADWGSGPGSDYYTFVPFQYLLNIDFDNFRLYLNTNDSNIVNNPVDFDDNNFIVLYGQRLHGDVTIPLDRFRPIQNEISFDVKSHGLGLELSMPSRNTLKSFVQSKNVAHLGSLVLTGSHTYMTETSAMNTDRLFLDITGNKLSLELYGWLIHHFMKIKDNYFGEDLHFKTLEEYQGLPTQPTAIDATIQNGQATKVSNDLDVILSISVEQGGVLLPSNLYSADSGLQADIPYVSADLRFTNYYMDLSVEFSPISLSVGSGGNSSNQWKATSGQTQVFVDSVAIYGHRLFGLPPSEPTYVCNWDFDVGSITGECNSDLVEKAVGVARCFAFTLDDPENTLAMTDPIIIHDSTFLRLKTKHIHLWVHVASEALLVTTDPITLEFNDLAGALFSQQLKASVPNLTVIIVDGRSSSRHRARTAEDRKPLAIETYAFLQTSLSADMFRRKLHFTDEREKQQAHMREHDQRTNRTRHMLLDDPALPDVQQKDVKPPAMPFPGIPRPVSLYKPTEQGYTPSSEFSEQQSAGGDEYSSTSGRSAASLSESVRSNYRAQLYADNAERTQSRPRSSNLPDALRRNIDFTSNDTSTARNVRPTSVALSSSLAAPYFSMNEIEPDLSNVPTFPSLSLSFGEESNDDDDVTFNDVAKKHFDENFAHTSLIIGLEPGIRVLCTPKAVRCVSDIFNLCLPRVPEDLLDDFHVRVMTKILDYQKRHEGKGNSLGFCIRVPFIHIRLQNDFGHSPYGFEGTDQYDILLNRLQVAARTKKFPDKQKEANTFALHAMLGSLGVSVTEKTSQGPSEDVAVQAEMRDILIWMLQGQETSVNLNFKSLEAATASRKVAYMAALVQRTMLLCDEFIAEFKEVDDMYRLRQRYIAWSLTNAHRQFPDPPFLTKASYALRAAKDHLRNHDSWKITSRFRYIWLRLPDMERRAIANGCLQKPADCPEGIEEKMVALWDQWRTWDLAHVRKSLAMKVLFGSTTTEETSGGVPFYMDLRAHYIKLIVDPGPTQSEAVLDILAVNIADIPRPPPTGLMLVPSELARRSTIVQVNSGHGSVRARWEICELAEKLATSFQQGQIDRQKPVQRKPSSAEKKKEGHEFQFIYVSEHAYASLDTINLQGSATGQRVRFSLAGSHGETRDEATVLVHMDQGVMRLQSRSRPLLRAQYDQPSLYVAHQRFNEAQKVPDEIKVAGASRRIELKVEEDILGILETADVVLRDEIAYIHRQITALRRPQEEKVSEPQHPDLSSEQLPNITLALLMDEYIVELALLQSLTWTIAGSYGRVSVIPSLGRDVTLRVDYDLAAHTHSMSSKSHRQTNVISSLDLPPLNGRVAVTNTQSETIIGASSIIETIELQAAEVQAIVATINKPEVSHALATIREDIGILSNHVQETFPRSDRSPPTSPSAKSPRDTNFSINMTFSGLVVLANAPGKSPDSPSADLSVKLTSLQLNATNMGPNKVRLPLPEAIANMGELSVEMKLTDAETVRRCGNIAFGATFYATVEQDPGSLRRVYKIQSSGIDVNIFADTASVVVDVMNHLQDKIKDLDLTKERKYLRRLRHRQSRLSQRSDKDDKSGTASTDSGPLFASTYRLELLNIQVSWIVGTSIPPYPGTESEDLVLSFQRIYFSTRKGDSARLTIQNMQLQMVPVSQQKHQRSLNSALLPEIVFFVTYASANETRNIAFQAAGKSLDLRLDSKFILPANAIEQSIALAGKKFRTASANWSMTPTATGAQRTNPFGKKRLASLLVGANFAGAVVHINGSEASQVVGNKKSQKGRYSQFVGDNAKSSMVLQAPGIAVKVEYKDDGHDPSLNAELRIDGSNNTFYPTVVPLLIDISESIKVIVRDKNERSPDSDVMHDTITKPAAKLLDEDNLITADPSTILGRTRLNLGLRICKQEFSLSCQPIARVAAIAKLEDMYVTVNSVKSQEHGHFFAASAAIQNLQAKVQHVYSRESTFGFDVESIILSLMNSKHLSGTSGISAILKVNPTSLRINARQLQDFLLFREIWLPPEIRKRSQPSTSTVDQAPQEYLMQRYEQVTAATAFPWNANVAIADVSMELDLGQAIGKTSLHIRNLWASSKKSTDWEQNMCIGAEGIGLESTGRTSGFVELQGVKVRTSISWPSRELGIRQAPLVQASVGFDALRAKASFDYQPFVIADITDFNFLMYNVREQLKGAADRLVAVLDGGQAYIYCTATSAAQGLALHQAIERLVQENQQAYTQSLKDIEKYLRRKSSVSSPFSRSGSQSMIVPKPSDNSSKAPLTLHTDVVVTLRSIHLGVFPSTFVDTQIFCIEAEDVQARFAAALEHGKIHSGLGMKLGKLSVALASISTPKHTTPIADLIINDVLRSARSARGGIILRVPKVIASMHTWQAPDSDIIDYIFRSNLEGKVDVGWNYSRISYIRSMWSNHSRSLASRLGKPLPESNIKITSTAPQQPEPSGSAAPDANTDKPDASTTDKDKAKDKSSDPAQGEKITAEIKVPQSRYTYHALEPPVIETPQLRDMGEATPPLEWIGLHRDRLPNVTHQIVIVTLLEVAREVEEAYVRILGGS
jgi:hypothetical protein